MWAQRHTPRHGLLAGLLALITFASAAVAMTAGDSGASAGAAAAAPPAQVVADQDGDRTTILARGDDRDRGRGGRGR
jgi:hypothetical protein